MFSQSALSAAPFQAEAAIYSGGGAPSIGITTIFNNSDAALSLAQAHWGVHDLRREADMLSQKAKYGLRALIELARAEGAQLSAGALALRADAPRKFLEAILLELSHSHIVVSRRGKFGGYVLARSPLDITFAEIIRVIDGPLALAPCVSPGLGFRKCVDCPKLESCALREALLRTRQATAEVLEGYSLAEAAASTAPRSTDQLAAI